MYRILLLLFSICIILSKANGQVQKSITPDKEFTITDIRVFILDFYEGKTVVGQTQEIEATYDGEKFILDFKGENKCDSIYTPLKRDLLSSKISAIFGKPIHINSSNDVMFWLYSFIYDTDEVTAGKLYLNKYIYVKSPSTPNLGSEEKKEMVYNARTELTKQKMNVLLEQGKLNEKVKELEELRKEKNKNFPKVEETLKNLKVKREEEKELRKKIEKSNIILLKEDSIKIISEKDSSINLKNMEQISIDSLKRDIKSKEILLNEMNKKNEQFKDSLKKDSITNDDFKELQDSLRSKSDKIKDLKKLMTETSLQVVNHEKEESKLSKNIKSLDSKADSISKILKNLKALEVERSKIDKSILEIENSIDALKKDNLDNLDVSIEQLKDSIEVLKKTLKKKKGEYENKRMSWQKKNVFEIKKVSLQFERGFLERIQVSVTNKYGGEDIYENIYAIGFSSILNYKRLSQTSLIIRDIEHDKKIILGDVFENYENFLDLYTRDYSPADTVFNHINPNETPYLILKKEKILNLVESRIYSDIVGINSETPNGLLQFELSRSFNLNTHRIQLGYDRSDFGFFNYLNVYGNLTKIDQNNKYLSLKNDEIFRNGVLVSPDYIANIDLRKYQNFSLGVETNVFLYDRPDQKYTLYLYLVTNYGHTPILRTVSSGTESSNIDSVYLDAHTFNTGPKITFALFSERRIGFDFSYQFTHTSLLSNNEFIQVMSYKKSDTENRSTDRRAKNSHMLEMNLRLETSKSGQGQIFYRGRFFWQHGDMNTFFTQHQVGYAYNFLFRLK